MFDLDAYLRRLGLSGRPSLAELHSAHTTAIPFENLAPHLGEPVPLDADSLTAKLVAGGRGGYCFEQNLLFKAALEALGYEVEAHLARVRVGLQPGQIRGQTHMVLRVREGERSWHADVGFGGGTLIEPIPWGPGEEHEQGGWRYRVIEEDGEHVLRGIEDDEWSDIYAFVPQPVPMIDVEISNWWVSTAPESTFVTGFLVSRQWPDGRRLLLTDFGEPELLERTPERTERTAVEAAELPGLLDERFGLPGFRVDADGHLRR